MLVKVRGKGVKLNGIWKYKNEEAEISETEWEENKEYVDIIKDDEGEKLPQKGKELGIKNAHFMGKEKLEQLIQEYENKKDEVSDDGAKGEKSENTEDETKDGSDTDVGSNGESTPQE